MIQLDVLKGFEVELMVEGVVANKFVEGGGGVLIIVVLEGVVRGTQRQFSENICSEDDKTIGDLAFSERLL